ncbi:MAG: PAS domain-containing protein, partial [Jaaginema sp. PMC 1079.18]|nr:PAS domain-containing protein [Jaaginema sp. PMC 1079.18]
LYFTKQDNSYQINKTIRETCIFSQHSIISDPPFSRIDLVACRNVLIYFDTELKNKLIPLFHYALNSGGYLFLGPSENLSDSDQKDLFHTVDKQNRLFQRKESMILPQVEFPLSDRTQSRSLKTLQLSQSSDKRRKQRGVQEVIEQVLLQEYTPPCVIVNKQYEVVYFFGRTGKYLEPSQGIPSNNIIDLARRGLRLYLRTVIQKAFNTGKIVTQEKVAIENEDRVQLINLVVRPLRDNNQDSNLLMVIFKDTIVTPQIKEADSGESAEDSDRESPLVRDLEIELQTTKEHLRTTIEELETSNEELKSANEELLSMNEELQSSNEELQTSKEEMQSINEELETVNAELRNKVEELDAANSDVQNFLESTNIATIFLDLQLRIKQFTPVATNLFNFIQTDIGRPITDIALSLNEVDLSVDIRQVLRTLVPLEKDVQVTQENRHYKMRIMPYRTVENVIDGAVITFVDVTDLRQAKNEAEHWATQQSAIAELGLYAIQNASFSEICDRAVTIICKVLPSDFCSLFRCRNETTEEGNQLLLSIGKNWPEDMVGNALIDVHHSQVGYTLGQSSPVVVQDADTENRFSLLPILRDRGIEVKSGLSVKIHGTDRPYGVLAIHSYPAYQYTSEDTSFLQAIANTISAAFQRHQKTEALAQSSNRLDLAITAGQMGIWEYDAVTGLSNWNDIEYELFGLNPAEVTQASGDLFYQYVHPEDVERVRKNFEAKIAAQEEFIDEFRVIHPNGQLRWLAARGRVVADQQGNVTKVIGVNYDVSNRKQNEEALKEADQRKDRFLASLGHELRNPLSVLYHSLSLLKNADSRDRETQIQVIMERQVRLLRRLIDDLLDASRLAYGKIQISCESLDLNQLIQQIVEDRQLDFEQQNLECDLQLPEHPIWIDGDRIRLIQAFSNILNNASKFSNEGDRIEIRVEAQNRRVTVVIADTGIGMSPEALTRIFTAFSQEENRQQLSSGGLGLGLPVTQGIIELHRGRVWASSDGLGQGSQFYIELPRIVDEIEPSDSLPDSSPDDSTPDTISGRVLVIEDNFDSALLIQLLLEDLGYDVELAYDGNEGLTKAESFKPNLVISDIGLPGEMDGYGVARAIRSNPELQSIYLVAMSGYGQQEDKDQAKAAGFNFHITKPIDLNELQRLIQSQVS